MSLRAGEETRNGTPWQGQGAADPFAESPGFFFTGAQRQHQLDTLGHLVAFGDMVLLVTGDTGAGKSRLLAELARNAAHRLSVQRLRADGLADASALPGMLSRLSGQALVGMAPVDAAREFFRWTAAQSERDRRWVLLVDDAEAMGDDVLAALVDGFSGSDPGKAAVPVLAGTEGLRTREPLGDPSRNAMLHEALLPPLREEDVRHFIHSSFDHVGGDATPWLTDAAVRRIQQQSGGNLRAIREVAPAILAGGAGGTRNTQRSGARRTLPSGFGRIPWRLWGGAVLLALGISLLLVSFQYDGSDEDGEGTAGPASEASEETLDEVERAREVIAETESSVEQEEPAEQQGVGEGRVRREGEPKLDVSPLAIPATGAPEAETAETDAPAADEENGEAGPDSAPVVETTASDDADADDGAEADSAPEEKEQAAFNPRNPERFRESSWYREEADGAFTLQLLGSFNESTALEFMERYEVGDAVYTRTRHQGEPWFVVVHGTYPDRDAARAAVESLPEEVRDLNPWPRAYEDL